MWKKVLYFGVAIVIGILVYIIGYSSNQMNHLESMVTSAIEKEEFYKVPMVWGGCFDTKSIVENNSDKLDFMVYPATSQTDVTYGNEENTGRYLEFERAYYVYLFNAKFSVNTATDGTSNYNKTAIEFTSNDSGSTSYNYYFVVNETMNSSVYVKEPTTKEEVLLNNERDVTNTNSTWNFMRLTLTETMLKQISKEMKGKIHKISIKDCDGSEVYSANISLDFSQEFFKNEKIEEILTKYNTYLSAYLAADGDSAKLKELNNTWGKEFEAWKEDFREDIPNTDYAIGYERDVVTPSKLVWQTIGMIVLYAVVILLFYVLLFHFSAIRRIFSKDNYKDYSKDSKIIVNGKAVSRTKNKPTSKIKEETISPDTSVDDSLETVTAGEVVVAPEFNSPKPDSNEVSVEEKEKVVAEPSPVEEPLVSEEGQSVVDDALESKEEQPMVEEVKEVKETSILEKQTVEIEESVETEKVEEDKEPIKIESKQVVKKQATKPTTSTKSSEDNKKEPKKPTTKKTTSSKKGTSSSKSTANKKSSSKASTSNVKEE